MSTIVLYMMKLCVLLSADFPLVVFSYINLSLGSFLLICLFLCVKPAASMPYPLIIFYKCLSLESEWN